ncbi:hypothetical protein P0Y35_09680 [Kiritimatiellaeota bacterium B1221]|nr:hypothetical protein [Kiritimatiellaeota bacterium B1221]
MRVILLVLAALAFLGGIGIFSAAESAIHEIEAFMLFLIAAVLLSGAVVAEQVMLMRKKLEVFLSKLDVG